MTTRGQPNRTESVLPHLHMMDKPHGQVFCGYTCPYLRALPCSLNGKHVSSKISRGGGAQRVPSGSWPPWVSPGDVHHPWGLLSLRPHMLGVQTPRSQTPHTQASRSSLPPACQRSPSDLFSSTFPRFLLTAVALLSSYSIHLLLKSSGIVGEPQTWPVAGRSGLGRALLTVLIPCPHRHPCL